MPYSKMTPANHIVRHFSSLLLQAVGRKKKTLIPTLMLICSDLVFVSENIYKLRYNSTTNILYACHHKPLLNTNLIKGHTFLKQKMIKNKIMDFRNGVKIYKL